MAGIAVSEAVQMGSESGTVEDSLTVDTVITITDGRGTVAREHLKLDANGFSTPSLFFYYYEKKSIFSYIYLITTK